MICWAKNVSTSCCTVQSDEHYISKGLFTSKVVKVSGFKFLNGETKELPIDRLVRKCLCQTHNNALSPVDAEAIRLVDALKYAISLRSRRSRERKKRWSVHRRELDYSKVKRWFVKTILGMEVFFSKDHNLVLDPDVLAKLAFGELDIHSYVNLEIANKVDEDLVIDEMVSVMPIYLADLCIGIAVEIYGFKLICKLNGCSVEKKKNIRVRVLENNKLSYVIDFK